MEQEEVLRDHEYRYEHLAHRATSTEYGTSTRRTLPIESLSHNAAIVDHRTNQSSPRIANKSLSSNADEHAIEHREILQSRTKH